MFHAYQVFNLISLTATLQQENFNFDMSANLTDTILTHFHHTLLQPEISFGRQPAPEVVNVYLDVR